MQNCRYRIKNWSEYNRALINRGNIIFWVESEALKSWNSSIHSCRPGRPEVYSSEAILLMLVLRETFRLSLRSLQGFVTSVFSLMRITLKIPCYTQVSRRAKSLHKKIPKISPSKGVKHLVFDSTGLKVFGEGEWKVRVHGKGKRRTWRKFHIGIDADTQEIVAFDLTTNSCGDAETAAALLSSMNRKVDNVLGDGAYDGAVFRRVAHGAGANCIVPPPKNARYKRAEEGWERKRDAILAMIEGLGGGEIGRKLWKMLSGYHRRSLGETAFSRIKRLLGGGLKARTGGAQYTEALCKCLTINKMNKFGMPKGFWKMADA